MWVDGMNFGLQTMNLGCSFFLLNHRFVAMFVSIPNQECFLGTISDRTANHLCYKDSASFDPGRYHLCRMYFFSINRLLINDISIYSQYGDICEYLNPEIGAINR